VEVEASHTDKTAITHAPLHGFESFYLHRKEVSKGYPCTCLAFESMQNCGPRVAPHTFRRIYRTFYAVLIKMGRLPYNTRTNGPKLPYFTSLPIVIRACAVQATQWQCQCSRATTRLSEADLCSGVWALMCVQMCADVADVAWRAHVTLSASPIVISGFVAWAL
jgi:hypothetical protein